MHRPGLSYANVVSTLCLLLLVAGGTAWALGRNSVASKHIKNNAVGFADLKGVKSWSKGVKPSGFGPDAQSARDDAKPILLFKRGTLSVYGLCYRNTTNGTLFTGAWVRSSADGAVMVSEWGAPDRTGQTAYLDADTPENERTLISLGTHTDNVLIEELDRGRFYLVAAGRKLQLNGLVQVGVSAGSPAAGPGPYGNGGRCLMSGYVIG